MLILIVSPSLNLRSNSCFGFSFSFSICSRFFNHLKWSWRATFRSKLSDLSKKPTPINADRPLSSWILRTKYLDESVTGSTAIPGYCSIGHLANSSPVILSSSFIVMLSPCDTNRIRPVQEGSCRFQSAALWQNVNFEIDSVNTEKASSMCFNMYYLYFIRATRTSSLRETTDPSLITYWTAQWNVAWRGVSRLPITPVGRPWWNFEDKHLGFHQEDALVRLHCRWRVSQETIARTITGNVLLTRLLFEGSFALFWQMSAMISRDLITLSWVTPPVFPSHHSLPHFSAHELSID